MTQRLSSAALKAIGTPFALRTLTPLNGTALVPPVLVHRVPSTGTCKPPAPPASLAGGAGAPPAFREAGGPADQVQLNSGSFPVFHAFHASQLEAGDRGQGVGQINTLPTVVARGACRFEQVPVVARGAGALGQVPVFHPQPFPPLSVRQVHLTTDPSRRAHEPPPLEDDVAASRDDVASVENSRAAVRPLYRALMAAVGRLGAQVQRYGTTEIFSAAEIAWIADTFPGAIFALRSGEGAAVKEYVGRRFREPLLSQQDDIKGMKKELGARLDNGFGILSRITRRLDLLHDHAVSSTSDNVTRGIRVLVECEMNTVDGRLGAVYHYKVTLRNEGMQEPVQLINRHWVITDFDGRTQQVIGPGVVGYHPVLDPGEEFEYTSYTPLMSKRGTQRGTFSMLATQSKELFDVRVGPFALIPRP